MCMGFLPVALWVEEELVAIHEDETLKAWLLYEKKTS